MEYYMAMRKNEIHFLLKCTWNILLNRSHVRPQTSLNKFRKINIITCIFSEHNSMKLEIYHKKKSGKNANTWRLNDMLLYNEWVNEEIKEEIKKTWRQMKMKTVQNLWGVAKAILKGKFIEI